MLQKWSEIILPTLPSLSQILYTWDITKLQTNDQTTWLETDEFEDVELLLSLRLTDLDLMIGGFRLIVLGVEEDLGRMLLLMLLLL